MSMRGITILSVLALALAVVALVVTLTKDERGQHLVTWNIYRGELQTESTVYEVVIEEVNQGSLQRHISLRPVGGPSYVGITGHDWNSDGHWDCLFYCGNHDLVQSDPDGSVLGCNSVVRTKSGWTFKPCSGDKGVVEPFSDEAISFAIAELDAAMEQVHNEDNLDQRWEWNPDQQKVVKVFDKSG